jgi:hypothetical protein
MDVTSHNGYIIEGWENAGKLGSLRASIRIAAEILERIGPKLPDEHDLAALSAKDLREALAFIGPLQCETFYRAVPSRTVAATVVGQPRDEHDAPRRV